MNIFSLWYTNVQLKTDVTLLKKKFTWECFSQTDQQVYIAHVPLTQKPLRDCACYVS